ncbi:MAG: beta-lactamase family protein, partial [Proteobacteria bacterium]|nr:beta-lactamase family protein [Pseudomonadota bacterium]
MYKTLIEKHFQPFIETIKPPALVAGLMKEGKLVETFSHSTSQCALPPEQWLFRIASMTKCFTAAAALLLRDQGKLQLSDRVIDYLPQLKNHASFSEITIYQLLTMQCGLPTDDPWADRYLGCTVSEFDQILSGNFSFVATAGTEYHYSNLGYMILGRVLSKAADVSILKFISDHILNPLEMKDTVWNTESLGRQLGFCYDQDKLKAETGFVVKDDSAVFAGLWSSVADLSKWIAFLLDADHHMTSEFESILSAT